MRLLKQMLNRRDFQHSTHSLITYKHCPEDKDLSDLIFDPSRQRSDVPIFVNLGEYTPGPENKLNMFSILNNFKPCPWRKSKPVPCQTASMVTSKLRHQNFVRVPPFQIANYLVCTTESTQSIKNNCVIEPYSNQNSESKERLSDMCSASPAVTKPFDIPRVKVLLK